MVVVSRTFFIQQDIEEVGMNTQINDLNCKPVDTSRTVDIIWNMTLVCSWDCPVCCVDAIHVARKNGNIVLRSKGLSVTETIPTSGKCGTIFDQAIKYRQQQGSELTLESKLQILENIKGFKVKLDFSGGDPLSARENLDVMRKASEQLGRRQITLTATGAGLASYEPSEISPFIGELNFTYDDVTIRGGRNRPDGYALSNLKKAAQFANAGVKTRAECPLTVRNINKRVLSQLYLDLYERGIDKLLLIRLFPVGRGTLLPEEVPTNAQYREAIEVLREMEARYGGTKIKLQCALKWFDNELLEKNPCDLFSESLGLTSRGTLLASPWAIGPNGEPLDDVWVLGNLGDNTLAELLSSEKASKYAARLNENFGHCKIHSYLNSMLPNKFDRIFDKADPMYFKPLERAAIEMR